MPNPSIKNEKLYEDLREEGNSKQKSARIANAAGSPRRAARLTAAKSDDTDRAGPVNPADLPQIFALVADIEGAEADVATNTVSVPAPNGVATLVEVLRRIESLGVDLHDISLRKPSLDEVFLHLTSSTLTV